MSENLNQSAVWQVPAGYAPVPSAIEGISVYAPVIEEEEEKPTTFKCPQCGATTRYDVSAGGVTCEHCGYTAAAQSKQVGRRAEEFEFTLQTLQRATQGWGTDRIEILCESCGASLAIPAGALTSNCPFCASNRVNRRPAAGEQLRPLFLIPFKIKAEEIGPLTAAWLRQGWFHPAELSQGAKLGNFTGIYLPFWTFDARIISDWKAEVGYERQESYYDSDSKEWKTRTVIDWRWEDGQVTTNIDDLLIGGSSHVSHTILERIYPFDLNQLVTYAPDYLAGWQAHSYDLTLPQAWERGKTAMREQARTACYNDIPTSHVRNFSMTADFADESWRYILLPVYLTAYQFEQRVFQVMVNGQTGSVAGQKPVAWWKIWLAIAAMLAPGLLACLIGLPLLLAAGAGLIVLTIGVILLATGATFAYRLYRQAVASEAGG